VPLSCFALTLLCPYFSSHYFIFVRTSASVPLFFCALTLLCPLFFVRIYPAVPLSCFTLTLLCLYFLRTYLIYRKNLLPGEIAAELGWVSSNPIRITIS